MADVVSKTSLFSSSRLHLSSICVSSCTKKSSSITRFSSLKTQPLRLSTKSEFHGRRITLQEDGSKPKTRNLQASLPLHMIICIGNALKWWKKGIQPNMKEITSAQDLVDSLSNAGDKLVIVDFFSPGCGACKPLHPKICQFAEMNPDVDFLEVNCEEHKSMCYSLRVHTFPLFRFYRGAHGRLCSFSCTNATIKKFKDALAKHTTDRCSLGPTKGMEEEELLALATNIDLSFNYTPKPVILPIHEDIDVEPPSAYLKLQPPKEKPLITAWR